MSCKRVFDPRLRRCPVVVLWNHDGCVVARSNSATRLGITMGVPLFKVRDLVDANYVATLSSNYALYGDMRARVMATLREITPAVEEYSIDEAFLQVRDEAEADKVARALRKKVDWWTGLPVSVGISPTKVLAKVANRAAKRAGVGVFALTPENADEVLDSLPVGEVRGVGRQNGRLLRSLGIMSTLQLRNLDVRRARRLLTVVGARTS